MKKIDFLCGKGITKETVIPFSMESLGKHTQTIMASITNAVIVSCVGISTFLILDGNIQLYSSKHLLVIPDGYSPSNTTLSNVMVSLSGTGGTENGFEITADSFYSFSDGKRNFVVSDTDGSYDYGFVTRKKIGKITYLYSHNSYKYTENTGYYIYNSWSEGTVITTNDGKKYEVMKTDVLDFNKGVDDYYAKGDFADLVYFTCTPYGDNVRKVYLFKEVR